MMFLHGKVRFPPVKIKLHWPDYYCKLCCQETVQVMRQPFEIYWCPSCDHYSAGRTEYVDATVRPVVNA